MSVQKIKAGLCRYTVCLLMGRPCFDRAQSWPTGVTCEVARPVMQVLLSPPRRLCFCQSLFVCLSLCSQD